jgi:hypothetical protein
VFADEVLPMIVHQGAVDLGRRHLPDLVADLFDLGKGELLRRVLKY